MFKRNPTLQPGQPWGRPATRPRSAKVLRGVPGTHTQVQPGCRRRGPKRKAPGPGPSLGDHSPAQGDFDGGGEARGEQVGREVRDHGQELVGLAGCQLNAVLHGRGQGHLGQWVVGVDSGHLQGQEGRGRLSNWHNQRASPRRDAKAGPGPRAGSWGSSRRRLSRDERPLSGRGPSDTLAASLWPVFSTVFPRDSRTTQRLEAFPSLPLVASLTWHDPAVVCVWGHRHMLQDVDTGATEMLAAHRSLSSLQAHRGRKSQPWTQRAGRPGWLKVILFLLCVSHFRLGTMRFGV